MEKSELDIVFSALSDPTRRAILQRLAKGQATVNELAEPFDMSQPAVSRHLKVLEQAGLITRDVDQQRRPARLRGDHLAIAADWLSEFEQFWTNSFHQLDDVLAELKQAIREESDNE